MSEEEKSRICKAWLHKIARINWFSNDDRLFMGISY